ncbi:MAG: proprotein convertase P-domain-containing protein [Planctomycetota bacterium]|jgi:hypothetical protein
MNTRLMMPVLPLALASLGATALADVQVNQHVENSQEQPTIAGAGDGSALAIWRTFVRYEIPPDAWEIHGRRLDASGRPSGEEFQIYGDPGNAEPFDPAVAVAADGSHAIVGWRNEAPIDSGQFEVRVSRVSLVGSEPTVSDPPAQVSTAETTESSATVPRVAVDDVGNAMVVWAGVLDARMGTDILARAYDAQERRWTGLLVVNQTRISDQLAPDVKVDASGLFHVSWSGNVNTFEDSLYLRTLGSDGVSVSPEQQVDSGFPGIQRFRPVLATGPGDLIAMAFSRYDGAATQLRTRLFQYDGARSCYKLIADSFVAPTSSLSYGIAVRQGEEVTVTWPDSGGLWAQRMLASGKAEGPAYRINAVVPVGLLASSSSRYFGFSPPVVWAADSDVFAVTSADCNQNDVPDTVDMQARDLADCNGNGLPDACDQDCDGNDIPDECDLLPSGHETYRDVRPLPVVIPDAKRGEDGSVTLEVFVAAPSSEVVLDLNVSIVHDHQNNSDLHVSLAHVESAVEVTLVGAQTGSADGMDVLLDDEAQVGVSQAVNDGVSPDIEGRYRPAQPLSVFNGLQEQGTWRLTVRDTVPGNTGTLIDWSLQFATDPPASQDCNLNSRPDTCDIAAGTSADDFGVWPEVSCEPNQVPDECEWPPGRPFSRSRLHAASSPDESECQWPDQQFHGGWSMVHSDADYGTRAAESWWSSREQAVHRIGWWGAYESVRGGFECDPIPVDDFVIRMYGDRGGLPGRLLRTVFAGEAVGRMATGETLTLVGRHEEYAYLYELAQPWEVEAGQTYWIEITNDALDGCAWSWETAPDSGPGDGTSLWDPFGFRYELYPFDLALCVFPYPDCNGNGIPDAEDIAKQQSVDCQADGIPDECQNDANSNGIADECDIANGAEDLNFNNIPDEIECLSTFGDSDRDCDRDLRDFVTFQSCLGLPSPEWSTGCPCYDVDHNALVEAEDFAVLAGQLNGPLSTSASCIPRLVEHCPDSWVTGGAEVGVTEYHFSGERAIPPGFFGPGSLLFDGVVSFSGRPSDPNGVWGNVDTQIEHAPIDFSEGTSVTVPAWMITLNLMAATPIQVDFDDGRTEAWYVLATLSPTFPGDGFLAATLDHPVSTGGRFDAVVLVQPLFIFVPAEALTGRVPPQCRINRTLDTAQSGLAPIEMQFLDQPFARGAEAPSIPGGYVSSCVHGSFQPGMTDGLAVSAQNMSAQAIALADGETGCLGHVTEDESHYFCPASCQSPSYCRYTRRNNSHLDVIYGCPGGIPATMPDEVPGIPCGKSEECQPEIPYLVHCTAGGVALAFYTDPECVTPPPSCRGACLDESCACAWLAEDDCKAAGHAYQGDGSTCGDIVDLDADSDASGLGACSAIEAGSVEDLIEEYGLGPMLCVNDDDDNQNDIADHLEMSVAGEDDWTCLSLSTACEDVESGFSWLLNWNSENDLRIRPSVSDGFRAVVPGKIYEFNHPDFPAGMPDQLYVEGIQPGLARISLEVIGEGGTSIGQDVVRIPVIKVDLDVDSDNNGFITESDDVIESHSDWYQHPGIVIPVNDDDDDGDGVVDFVDGYSLGVTTGDDLASPLGDDFVAVQLELAEPIDLGEATVRFWYDAPSDPLVFATTGRQGIAVPGEGLLRLWMQPEYVARNPLRADRGGHFIAPATPAEPLLMYRAVDLGYQPGRIHTFFVEAVRARQDPTGCELRVEVDPDGPGGPMPFSCADQVRLMPVRANLGWDTDGDGFGSEDDEWLEGYGPGKLLIVNDDDDDSDGVQDRWQGFAAGDDEWVMLVADFEPHDAPWMVGAGWSMSYPEFITIVRGDGSSTPVHSGQIYSWPPPAGMLVQSAAESLQAGDVELEMAVHIDDRVVVRDRVRATSATAIVDVCGNIEADLQQGSAAYLISPAFDPDLASSYTGASVRFLVHRNGRPAQAIERPLMEDGTAADFQTSTAAGDQYDVYVDAFGTMRKGTPFRIVSGTPDSIVIKSDPVTSVDDQVSQVLVTSYVQDAYANAADDGTTVGWMLAGSTGAIGLEQDQTELETTRGMARATIVAPFLPVAHTLVVSSSSVTADVDLPVETTTGALAGPDALDVATGEEGVVTLSTNAADGARVFWTISNGNTREMETIVRNGTSSISVSASKGRGHLARVGPCYVTASVGDGIFVHVLEFVSTGPFHLELDRFVISGDVLRDGEETYVLPQAPVIPEMPPVVDSYKVTVPYFAEASGTLHGRPGATFRIEHQDAAHADYLAIMGLDEDGLISLDAGGTATVHFRSMGHFDGVIPVSDFLQVPIVLTPIETCEPCAGPKPESQVEVIVLVEHGWWTRSVDAVQSFFGGDPETVTGIGANVAGGMLIVGDVGSLVKNSWRKWGWSEMDPSATEAALSSLRRHFPKHWSYFSSGRWTTRSNLAPLRVTLRS